MVGGKKGRPVPENYLDPRYVSPGRYEGLGWCQAVHEIGWQCTRRKGHCGKHVAHYHGGAYICAFNDKGRTVREYFPLPTEFEESAPVRMTEICSMVNAITENR